MKRWKIVNKGKGEAKGLKMDKIIKILLENRGLKTKKQKEEFLNPKLETVTPKSVGINLKELKKAVVKIKKAIKNKEQIIVFGDYDVDGICGSAILWETLHGLGANVLPYIPHRIDEGYGLSVKGISNLSFDPELRTEGQSPISNTKLIITVDNGIVASDAVDFANRNGIDVIITDHHVPSKKLPKAVAIVHTTKLCGAGVAYLLSQEIKNSKFPGLAPRSLAKGGRSGAGKIQNDHLALAALATVADLVPLLGANRTLLVHGFKTLHATKRVGLVALFKEAALDQETISVYEIGHMIAPRLNAMGRLESAIDSLRLLCTKDTAKAQRLSQLLGKTNRERQLVTEEACAHAKSEVRNRKSEIGNLIFIADTSYQQGVIGLVAGKLVEEFYRPSIVVSIGKTYSKASARSVNGFNIIEFIRSASHLLVDAGGHPMAAGFTVETAKLPLLKKTLEERAEKALLKDLLSRSLVIDYDILLSLVDTKLYDKIQRLAPFGMKNPEPTFISRNVVIADMRLVGQEGKHLKLRIHESGIRNHESRVFDAIAFGMGEKTGEFETGNTVDIAYCIDKNTWNGSTSLQLTIKDIKKS